MARSMALRNQMKYEEKAPKSIPLTAPKAPKMNKSALAMSATKKGKC